MERLVVWGGVIFMAYSEIEWVFYLIKLYKITQWSSLAIYQLPDDPPPPEEPPPPENPPDE
jgi:hypothetical protein